MTAKPHPADVIGDAVTGWRDAVNAAHPGVQIREAMRQGHCDGVNRYLAIACYPSIAIAVAVVTCEYRPSSAELRIVATDLSPIEAVLGRPGGGVPFEDLPEPFRAIASARGGALVKANVHGVFRTKDARPT